MIGNILIHAKKRWQACIFLLLFCVCAFLLSCASAPKDGYAAKSFDKAYSEGKYEDCAKMRIEADDERIDYVLDAAMLYHAAGNWDASRSAFEAGEKRIDEAFTKSITRTAAATLFNDNIKEYPGNIYEYLMLNAFNSLNYYNQGDLEGAMVEIRKLDVKNKEYVNQYGETALIDPSGDDSGLTSSSLAKAGVNMSEIMSRSPKKPTEEDIYRDSALVRYLGLVFRTMYGDNAGNNEIDGRYLAALNSDFANAVSDELSIPSGMGRLDVLAMTGKIAEREAAYNTFPLGLLAGLAPHLLLAVGDPSLFNLTFGFPRYVSEAESVIPISVIVKSQNVAGENANGESGEGGNAGENESESSIDIKKLESFDEAVRKDVAVKARRAYIRSIYRSASKKITTIASSEASLAAAENGSDLAYLIAQATAATAIRGALAALDKSEVPDTRQCKYFPKSAYAGGVNVPPGTYNVIIKYSNGTVQTKEGVAVQRGKITLVEEVCVK